MDQGAGDEGCEWKCLPRPQIDCEIINGAFEFTPQLVCVISRMWFLNSISGFILAHYNTYLVPWPTN